MPERLALIASLAALSLMSTASVAAASVTIGGVPADTPANSCTNLREDWVQSEPIVGNPYAVPALAGSITSWSTQTSATGGQVWTMKVLRHVSGSTYTVVAHDGPRALTPGILNTFKTNIPVMPGDLIGMNDNDTDSPVSTACSYVSPGDTTSWFFGSLGDGQSGEFASSVPNRRLNIEATFEPQNRFAVSAIARNKKRGTASITVDLPNPGELIASAAGVKVAFAAGATSKAVPAGPAQVKVKAKGKKRRKLNRKGRAKINVAFTYTPTGGASRVQHAKLRLIKRR